MVTLRELVCDNFDEVSFLERFNVSLDDLLDAFWDRVEEQQQQLEEELWDGSDDDPQDEE